MESTIYTVNGQSFELRHYGVKGMKWGHRKASAKQTQKWGAQKARKEYAELDRRKAAAKKAQKDYDRAFNKAYNRSAGALSPFKKHRQNAQKRWEDAATKAEKLQNAKKAYKEQKKAVRKNTTVGQKIGRGAKATGKALQAVGTAFVYDQAFNGGRYTKATKAAVKVAGMTAITAYTAARGGTNIQWYDKKTGKRII